MKIPSYDACNQILKNNVFRNINSFGRKTNAKTVNSIHPTGISVRNGSFTSSSTNCIIRNISVNFEVGNIYFITGKSGSGKTTFLDILAGLYNFDSRLSLSYLYHGNVIDSMK